MAAGGWQTVCSETFRVGLWDWILNHWLQQTPPSSGSPHAASTERSVAVATLDPDDLQDDHDRETEKWWAPHGATMTEPPPPTRPNLDAEARSLENLLISHFDGHDLRMPPLLHVAETVLPRLRDPNYSLAEAARTLAQDQVVAAAVLRMANSPLFRGLSKIASLQPAVARLGTNALRTLLMHESFRAATFFRKGDATAYARFIWRRSLASACIMHALSKLTGVDSDEAFLTGLLVDIGNVLVLRIVFSDQGSTACEIDLDTFQYLCDECHQEFGELVADAWSLPPTLKTIISDHHTEPAQDDALRTQRLMIQLADMICALLGFALPVPYDLMNSRVVAELGLKGDADFIAMLERLPDDLEELTNAL